MDRLPKPQKQAIIYEDKYVYACLASFPVARGHTIVVWKNPVKDIHNLSDKQYKRLMGTVDVVRDALLKVLKIKKVYLLYMDEVKHVHWHLVPRFNERGINALSHSPGRAKNFPLAGALREEIRTILKGKR